MDAVSKHRQCGWFVFPLVHASLTICARAHCSRLTASQRGQVGTSKSSHREICQSMAQFTVQRLLEEVLNHNSKSYQPTTAS